MRPAARVENYARLRLQHRDERLDDGNGREVLAAALPLARRELSDEVLVHAAEPSFAPIERLAATFHTSLTASGYRFAAVTPHSVALVWSQSGQVRWAKRSDEFKEWLRSREGVDPRTCAADLFSGKQVAQGLQQVPADAWLESAATDATLLEESRLLPAYSAVLTVLWARDPLSERDEADELLSPLNPDEFSIRRTRWPTKRGSGA